MGLTEERRKEIERTLEIAREYLPGAWELETIAELLTAFAEAESDKIRLGRERDVWRDWKLVNEQTLQAAQEAVKRVHALEDENGRLRARIREIHEVCLEDSARYARPTEKAMGRVMELTRQPLPPGVGRYLSPAELAQVREFSRAVLEFENQGVASRDAVAVRALADRARTIFALLGTWEEPK